MPYSVDLNYSSLDSYFSSKLLLIDLDLSSLVIS